MNGKENSNHLPNLDSIRFLGAMVILILHAEDIKFKTGQESIPLLRHFYSGGDLVVSVFFVLSGFLITYLLLKEKQATHTINIKYFYTRRMLRIWPLYYLILLLGFFLLPLCDHFLSVPYFSELQSQTGYKLISSALFLLPAFLFTTSHLSLGLGPLWSVMVEEVFYLFWPLLIKKSKNYLRLFIWVIVTVLLVRLITLLVIFFAHKHSESSQNETYLYLQRMVIDYRYSCMAIGAIGAYLVVFDQIKALRFIYRKDVQWATILITAILLVLKVHIPFFYHEFYSVLFCITLVNMATNPHTVLNLKSKWMAYIGKMSYGIYIFNPITRIFCLEFTKYIFGKQVTGWQMETIFFSLCIVSTIGVAALSYKFFEIPFLKLKKRYTVVVSV